MDARCIQIQQVLAKQWRKNWAQIIESLSSIESKGTYFYAWWVNAKNFCFCFFFFKWGTASLRLRLDPSIESSGLGVRSMRFPHPRKCKQQCGIDGNVRWQRNEKKNRHHTREPARRRDSTLWRRHLLANGRTRWPPKTTVERRLETFLVKHGCIFP